MAFWDEIATQGHSRSCILESLKSRRQTANRHIIMLASSLKYPKNSQRKRRKLPLSTTPLSFDFLPVEPPRMSAKTLYRQKLESLTYIFAADSVGLSSFKFLWWAPNDASFLQQSAYRPFKVIQGR